MTLYLTTLECIHGCGKQWTIAHEGPEREPTEESPWPRARRACPFCGEVLPHDMGVAIVEVREAEVLPPPTEREAESMTQKEELEKLGQDLERAANFHPNDCVNDPRDDPTAEAVHRVSNVLGTGFLLLSKRLGNTNNWLWDIKERLG